MAPDPVQLLRDVFGYPGFRPGQEALVRAALEGRDALGVLPTGGGKSVCYQVPAFLVDGLTLVVTPLVSLMEDQVRRARALGLAADALSGTQEPEAKAAVEDRLRSGATRLLFVSPERLELPHFRRTLDAVRVALVAVDEAHCISEWGHDFRPAYRRIGRLTDGLSCPTLALTASATPAVRADIVENLRLTRPLEVVRSFDRPNLHWAVVGAGGRPARLRAVHAALRRFPGSAIVYAPTRRWVEAMRDHLAACGMPSAAYHAGLAGAERSSVQERFMDGAVRVVVATNAFGMGIDKADVRVVVHVQLPTTLEAYYQEAGRAGRDGAPSACIGFHGRGDGRLGRRFVDRSHPRRRRLRRIHRALRRAADEAGVALVDAPDVVRALGRTPRGWMDGEPEGPLGCLERIGGIRRLPPAPGTGTTGPVSQSRRVGVRAAPDMAAATRGRARALSKSKAVARFARSAECRRRVLLRYFGEDAPSPCRRCDRCGWNLERGFSAPDG